MPATLIKRNPRKQPAERVTPVTDSDLNLSFSMPLTAMNHDGFRAWALSGGYPEQGQVSFLGDEVFVDMSPERASSHNTPKGDLYYGLYQYMLETRSGEVFADKMLVTNKPAELSNEPDMTFVKHDTVLSGRVTYRKTTDGEDVIEIVGAPDLVVEIISPSSVTKDTKTLRTRYHRGGIPEYWILDARSQTLVFQILVWSPEGYRDSTTAQDGLFSPVLNREVKITRERSPSNFWRHTLHLRPVTPSPQ